MRRFLLPAVLMPLILTGCGGSVFGSGPEADMTENYPSGMMADGHKSHQGHAHHGVLPMGPVTADMAPPQRDRRPSGPTVGVGMGGAQTVDVTPHAAIPDTEVTYGKNNTRG